MGMREVYRNEIADIVERLHEGRENTHWLWDALVEVADGRPAQEVLKDYGFVSAEPDDGEPQETYSPPYFVLFSKTSRFSISGWQMKITTATRNAIISMAERECHNIGEAFRTYINDYLSTIKTPQLDVNLEAAISKLGDNDRYFSVYPITTSGADLFLEHATFYGLKEQALSLIRVFIPSYTEQ